MPGRANRHQGENFIIPHSTSGIKQQKNPLMVMPVPAMRSRRGATIPHHIPESALRYPTVTACMVLSLMAHLKSPSDCQERQYQKNQHLHHSLQPRHHTNEVRYVWSLTNYTKYVKPGLNSRKKIAFKNV